jgi:hypothetical protein
LKLPDASAQEVVTPEAQLEIDLKFKAFIEKHKTRIEQWIDAHGSLRNLPVIVTAEGEYAWVNRQHRREWKKKYGKRR